MSSMKLSVVVCLFGLVTFSRQEDIPKVDTPLGGISGYYKVSRTGRKYEAYEGIPYAEPPVGELRFEPPKPVQRWGNVLPATKKGAACVQYRLTLVPHQEKVSGCEDCLYMNIYVPVKNSNETLLPVMFWIHGGAFQFGSALSVDERRLMDRNTILVVINYRVGPLGFLSTGDEVVPGNMGLKDQAMALRWVHENIRYFGGDPNKVTIFGYSAGGISVHFQYLSPQTAGLFQRGLSFSGTALNPRSIARNAPAKAKKLGKLLGCPTSTNIEMVACLKRRPSRLIGNAVSDFQYWLYNPTSPFGPVVENGGLAPFINCTPHEIISSGRAHDVPWVTGILSEDGLFPSIEFVANATRLKQLNDNWDQLAPYILTLSESVPPNKLKGVVETIRKRYLGSKKIDSDTVTPLIHMLGDRQYSVGFEKAVRLQAKNNKSPVWGYYYSYKSNYSITTQRAEFHKYFGVGHGDDVNLVLDAATLLDIDPTDIKMEHLLTDMYTSVAIQGRPHVNVNWQPINPDKEELNYLHIPNPDHLKMEASKNFANKNFWNTISSEETELPSDCKCQD